MGKLCNYLGYTCSTTWIIALPEDGPQIRYVLRTHYANQTYRQKSYNSNAIFVKVVSQGKECLNYAVSKNFVSWKTFCLTEAFRYPSLTVLRTVSRVPFFVRALKCVVVPHCPSVVELSVCSVCAGGGGEGQGPLSLNTSR